MSSGPRSAVREWLKSQGGTVRQSLVCSLSPCDGMLALEALLALSAGHLARRSNALREASRPSPAPSMVTHRLGSHRCPAGTRAHGACQDLPGCPQMASAGPAPSVVIRSPCTASSTNAPGQWVTGSRLSFSGLSLLLGLAGLPLLACWGSHDPRFTALPWRVVNWWSR